MVNKSPLTKSKNTFLVLLILDSFAVDFDKKSRDSRSKPMWFRIKTLDVQLCNFFSYRFFSSLKDVGNNIWFAKSW